MNKQNPLIVPTLLLSIVALFLSETRLASTPSLTAAVDYTILLMILMEIRLDYRRATYKRVYIKRSAGALLFALIYFGLFLYAQLTPVSSTVAVSRFPTVVVIIRNVCISLRIFDRLRRLSAILYEISTRPAQTILLSFFVVIVAGALLLMLPFTSATSEGLSFVDALFTATSAVCVTGLIVVDTATAFSIYGKIVILILIQIGGLGIMLLSYFTVFIFRRSVSIEDKMLISYMISEGDMTRLARSLANIIYTTLAIELVGTVILTLGFFGRSGSLRESFALGVFHSVSAFCNAGFSLFSDSLRGFHDDPLVLLPMTMLILAGGLSFAVLTDLRRRVGSSFRRILRRGRVVSRASFNTRVVLASTAVLLVAGTLLFYGLEFRNAMSSDPAHVQYLSSFFQSVAFRTAGFNSIEFNRLRPPTYLLVTVFMFIGGASGSTAGGIKVNTVSVMLSYLVSTARDRETVVIYRHSIATATVTRAFLILFFGISAIFIGTLLLSLFEEAPIERIYFEAVSAFGTVGLSSGLTAALSIPGKCVIMLLMFLGRLGPLTILAAATRPRPKERIEYPRSEIAIG